MTECVLECSGVGAKYFLQGQLTCNVNDLNENTSQLAACCNLQGRVIFIAQVIMQSDQYFLLIVPESMKHIVFSHLEKYAKFSKCTLKYIEHVRTTDWSPSSHLQNILNGIPNIYPETSEKIIAQRLNLHLIPGTISFKKGCYLGQEIIARLHYKGTLKHHMYLGQISPKNEAALPEYNENITDKNGKETGVLIDFYIDEYKTLILFVNEIENTEPHWRQEKIKRLSLPYQ